MMGAETRDNSRGIVRASGEIDLSNVQELRSALEIASQESPLGLVIDLTPVTYIDSAGIQVIIAAYQRVYRRGGKIALVTGNENVRQIIALIHPEKLPGFLVCDDPKSAEKQVFDTNNA